jgi:hypothetical protein
MTRTEDRLADALNAAAQAVREDTLRPLAVPNPGDRRRQGRPGGWGSRRPGWLAPAAAAVAVALVIGLAVLAAQFSARHPAPEGLPPGTPRYYVQTAGAGGRPVVRSTATGALTGTVPVRASNALGYDLVTADRNGTFFVVAAPALNQGERLYKFRLTKTGRVTGFSAVPVGTLASRTWAADTLAVSPDGSRIALGMRFVAPPVLCPPARQPCPRQGSPDYVLAINLATGHRTVWRWAGSAVVHSFAVESLSWTSDDRTLALLGHWCTKGRTNETCARDGGLAEVMPLHPAAGGGELDGHWILVQSGPLPEIVQAQISPDGRSITAVVLHGRVPGYGHVRQYLSVDRISAVLGHFGQVQAVLYQRRLTDTFDPGRVPDFIALSQDATGQHLLLSGPGFDGWVRDGRLVSLTPVNGGVASQAW